MHLFGPGSSDLGIAYPRGTETTSNGPTAYDMHFNPRKYFNMTRPSDSGSQTLLVMAGDNEAVAKITRKCRSIATRHPPRTHKHDLTCLFKVCEASAIHLGHAKTDSQVADLMTKGFSSPEKWTDPFWRGEAH